MAPGRYQLRIGARNPVSGKTGTVFYDVLVPDFSKEPLMMSGLLLSVRCRCYCRGADAATRSGCGKAARCAAYQPSDVRQTDELAWMAEIYDNSPPKQPKQIEVSARLVDESGREAFASRDVLANGDAGAPKWQTFGYTGRPPRPRRPSLQTLPEVRREMARVYRDMRHGRIKTQDGTRLTYVPDPDCSKTIQAAELDARVEAVERALKLRSS